MIQLPCLKYDILFHMQKAYKTEARKNYIPAVNRMSCHVQSTPSLQNLQFLQPLNLIQHVLAIVTTW